MSLEEIVERILSSRGSLTRDKVLEMIEDKKKTAEGYFTNEVAARLVALELGVEIPWWRPLRSEVAIRDVVPGLNDVTLMGRVIDFYPVKTFTRQNKKAGKVARLFIEDETGTLGVVLWDAQTNLVRSRRIKRGQIVKISHGYVREGLEGKPELHVGTRGEIQVFSSDTAEGRHIPALPAKITKIQNLRIGMRNVDVLARVVHAGEIREFERQNGGTGQVSTLLIKDETGTIGLNLWDEKASLCERIHPGDIVLATRAYPRERSGRVNLNIGRQGVLTLNPKLVEAERLPNCEEPTTRISEIRESGSPITVKGTIKETPTFKEVITARDERVKVASFELADDTGKIRVSAWRKLAVVVKDLTAETEVKIRNAYAKKGFAAQLELTTRMFTSIEVLSRPEKQRS